MLPQYKRHGGEQQAEGGKWLVTRLQADAGRRQAAGQQAARQQARQRTSNKQERKQTDSCQVAREQVASGCRKFTCGKRCWQGGEVTRRRGARDKRQSINQSIVKFITRYFQVLSVSPVMNRKRGWDSGVSPSAGGRRASSGAT